MLHLPTVEIFGSSRADHDIFASDLFDNDVDASFCVADAVCGGDAVWEASRDAGGHRCVSQAHAGFAARYQVASGLLELLEAFYCPAACAQQRDYLRQDLGQCAANFERFQHTQRTDHNPDARLHVALAEAPLQIRDARQLLRQLHPSGLQELRVWGGGLRRALAVWLPVAVGGEGVVVGFGEGGVGVGVGGVGDDGPEGVVDVVGGVGFDEIAPVG